MANKQIHQLPAASALAPEDQLVVSQAGSNATRRASLGQPAVPAGAAGHRAAHHRRQARRDRLGQGLRRRRRRRRRRQRRLPGRARPARRDPCPGRHLPARQRDPGQAAPPPARRRPRRHGDRRPRPPAPSPSTATPAPSRSTPTAAGDWNRSAVSGMTIRMTKGGIRAHGHEFRATNLLFAGGTAPAGPGRPGRLVHRPGRRQRERAARDPGRLRRRGGPPPPGQRHPAGLQHARRSITATACCRRSRSSWVPPTPWPCCSRATAPA